MNNHESQPTGPDTAGADDGAAEPSDLNRALAEAIMQGVSPQGAAAFGQGKEPGASATGQMEWHSDKPAPRSTKLVLGIDYSPSQVAIVELSVSKRSRQLTGLTTSGCHGAFDAAQLRELLNSNPYPQGTEVHLTITSPRAVVRHFRLPKLPRRRRETAARWEARKLIPFSLSPESAIYGFDFAADDGGGTRVTLVAVPREDTAGILDIMQELRWDVQSVSVAGTKLTESPERPASEAPPAPLAVLHWSPLRVTFVAFKRDELLFHYDMGLLPLPESAPGQPVSTEPLQKWVRVLGRSVTDAFEFYTGSNPDHPIGQLDIYGVPDSVAPLITDWNERLNIPIQLKDPLQSHREALPPDVRRWLDRHGAEILSAYLGAIGRSTVDLTPESHRQRHRSHHLGILARTAFASSVAVLLAWGGLLWSQKTLAGRAGTRLDTELQILEASPIHAQIQECLTRTQTASNLHAAIDRQGSPWTPALKTIVASIPDQTRLLSLTAGSVPTAPDPSAANVRMEGIIYPTDRAHALILAEWLGRLQASFGPANVTLESTRTIEWKVNRKTAYVISIHVMGSADGGAS